MPIMLDGFRDLCRIFGKLWCRTCHHVTLYPAASFFSDGLDDLFVVHLFSLTRVALPFRRMSMGHWQIDPSARHAGFLPIQHLISEIVLSNVHSRCVHYGLVSLHVIDQSTSSQRESDRIAHRCAQHCRLEPDLILR